MYELCFTVFVLCRAISTRSEKMDSFARLRVLCESGFFVLFSLVHVHFIFRREQTARWIDLFLRVFTKLEGGAECFFLLHTFNPDTGFPNFNMSSLFVNEQLF